MATTAKDHRERRKANPEAERERDRIKREKYKQQRAEYYKKWRAANKDKSRGYDKKTKAKLKNDPIFKLKTNYRSRISEIVKLKGIRKTQGTQKLLGCEWKTFMTHLEIQFKPGMTWANYGQWHVDHIRPLALAESIEELFSLMSYINTQPLWAIENLKKGSRYSE